MDEETSWYGRIDSLDRVLARNCFNVFCSPYNTHNKKPKKEIPSLFCLQLHHPLSFVKDLERSHFDVLYIRGTSIIPMFFVLTNCPDAKINDFKNTKIVISVFLYRAMKYKNLHFVDFVRNRNIFAVSCLLNNVALKTLRTEGVSSKLYMCFEILTLDERLARNKVRRIICEFLEYAICELNGWIFTLIWSLLDHDYISTTRPKFLRTFIIQCRFSHSEFIHCLHLILQSPHVTKYLRFYGQIFWDLLGRSLRERLDQQQRLGMISSVLKIIPVGIFDIVVAYDTYGFNEEVVLFIHFLKHTSLALEELRFCYRFIMRLEKDPTLQINKLNEMEFSRKKSYLKLLQILPKYIFNKEIGEKYKILNSVPSLYEISNYHSQRFIQEFLKIEDSDKFCETVTNLNLPMRVKKSVMYKPPIYC